MKTQKVHIYTTGSSYRLDHEITDFCYTVIMAEQISNYTIIVMHEENLKNKKITMLAFKFNSCSVGFAPFSGK